jgi:Lipocalin-like domain
MPKLAALTVALFLLGFARMDALGQQSAAGKQIVGAWTVVSSDTIAADGTRSPTFGPNPKGLVIFDASGRYSLHLARSSGTPPFASNNRLQGTAEENKAVVQGSLSHVGTYVVSEPDSTLIFRIESSSFPNWNGTEQRRPLTIAGDELRWKTPAASGGGSAELVWKRAK